MDRETIVKASQGISGLVPLDVALVQPILMDFLIEEHHKPEDKVLQLLEFIFSTASWLPYFEVAVRYYERKFTICKVYTKEKQLIKVF